MTKYFSKTAIYALLMVIGILTLGFILPGGAWKLTLPLCGVMLVLVALSVLMRVLERRRADKAEKEKERTHENDDSDSV